MWWLISCFHDDMKVRIHTSVLVDLQVQISWSGPAQSAEIHVVPSVCGHIPFWQFWRSNHDILKHFWNVLWKVAAFSVFVVILCKMVSVFVKSCFVKQVKSYGFSKMSQRFANCRFVLPFRATVHFVPFLSSDLFPVIWSRYSLTVKCQRPAAFSDCRKRQNEKSWDHIKANDQLNNQWNQQRKCEGNMVSFCCNDNCDTNKQQTLLNAANILTEVILWYFELFKCAQTE